MVGSWINFDFSLTWRVDWNRQMSPSEAIDSRMGKGAIVITAFLYPIFAYPIGSTGWCWVIFTVRRKGSFTGTLHFSCLSSWSAYRWPVRASVMIARWFSFTVPAMDIESCLAVVSTWCAFLAMDIESCHADASPILKSTDVAGIMLTSIALMCCSRAFRYWQVPVAVRPFQLTHCYLPYEWVYYHE